MKSVVAVIVVTWNGKSHLEACMAALAAQTWRDFDLVVVDNGSSDGSGDWLGKQTLLPVRVVALPENRGFAGGNAAAWRTLGPETDLVVLLNNDTAPEPGWLAALVGAAESDVRRGAIASLIVDWTGETIDSAGDGIRVTGRGYQRYHGWPRAAAPASGPVFSACGGAALFRRTMLDAVGFLDERFFMNGEDTDLCFRARLAGWEVWYCAEAVVRHRVSASQGAGSALNIYYNERNHVWSVMKCMPAWLFAKYCWVHGLEQVARAVWHARRARFGAWARGVGAGLAGVLAFRWDRRQIQKSRRVSVQAIERYFLYPRMLGGRDDTPLPKP